MCYAERIDPFAKNAELPAGNLFEAFNDTAHAAAQSTGTERKSRGAGADDPRHVSDLQLDRGRHAVQRDCSAGHESVRDQGVQPARKYACGLEASKPTRVIEGRETDLEYNNGLYIDPKNGTSIRSRPTPPTPHRVPRNASGNTAPSRQLKTPHRNFAPPVDERGRGSSSRSSTRQGGRVSKQAAGNEQPLRVLEGPRTGLSDAHGMAIDVQKAVCSSATGAIRATTRFAGSGQFHLPSITVYPLDAKGDTPPLRTIQGTKTQLDGPRPWPSTPMRVTSSWPTISATRSSVHGEDDGDVRRRG